MSEVNHALLCFTSTQTAPGVFTIGYWVGASVSQGVLLMLGIKPWSYGLYINYFAD